MNPKINPYDVAAIQLMLILTGLVTARILFRRDVTGWIVVYTIVLLLLFATEAALDFTGAWR
jgi:hypothetical protein